MADIVRPEVRSRMMAGIRSKDTKPEIMVRRALHARGFRFRLHKRDLPGRPDLVLAKHNAAIFVHGCFWHGHNCGAFRLPKTRTAFWHDKISTNLARDQRSVSRLADEGWRVRIVWECDLRRNASSAVADLANWLDTKPA
jgi:DNA mismatch endonuclease, patch repair protein